MEESGNMQEEEVDTEPWVRMQKETFGNWVNNRLGEAAIKDLRVDLRDGVYLCRLMEVLRNVKFHKIKQQKNMNHFQASNNINQALEAMRADNIKLVNIGTEDISNGNLKLILGMCWLLVRRYQIGAKSRVPTKKVMLTWINAVLHPHCEVTNFGSDWSDGVALHGVMEFCRPGTCPQWYNMNRMDRLVNCTQALQMAESLFDIPMVVSAENLASGDLDELSGMTYLSYFMAEGSPGYRATLSWAEQVLSPTTVQNFTSDWSDGVRAEELVEKLGGSLPPGSRHSDDRFVTALSVAQRDLGLPPEMKARDFFAPDGDHIGIMAFVATLLRCCPDAAPRDEPAPPPVPPHLPEPEPEPEPLTSPSTAGHNRSPEGIWNRQYQENMDPRGSKADRQTEEAEEEDDKEEQEEEKKDNYPEEGHQAEDLTHIEDVQPLRQPGPVVENGFDSDVQVRLPREWAIKQPLTFHIKSLNSLGRQFQVEARSPSSTEHYLSVKRTDISLYDVTFTPEEAGVWSITVTEEHTTLHGSPYRLTCYDASKAEIRRDDEGYASRGEPYTFTVDTSSAHLDHLRVHVLHEDRTVSAEVTPKGRQCSRVTFTPETTGNYHIAVYLGGIQVAGSPFTIEAENAGEVVASGEGLRSGAVGHVGRFELDTSQYRGKSISVDVKGPGGTDVKEEISRKGDIIYVSYIPRFPGLHSIGVIYNNVPIQGSPFQCDVKSATVYVYDLPEEAKCHKTHSFIVDAREMAKGTLEIDSDMPVLSYEKEGDKKFRVTFVPRSAGRHDIVIKYNQIVVADSPYHVTVR